MRTVSSPTWAPGDPVWRGLVDDGHVAVQVRPILNGFHLSHMRRLGRTRACTRGARRSWPR